MHCFLLDIASELLEHIISFLPKADLLAMSQTCASVRPLCFNPSLTGWNRQLHVDNVSHPTNSLQFLLTYESQPLSKLKILRFDRVSAVAAFLAVSQQLGAKFEHVHSLSIGDSRHFLSFFQLPKQRQLVQTMPNLRHLHFDVRLHGYISQLCKILRSSSKLEILSFGRDRKQSAWLLFATRYWDGHELMQKVPSLKRVDDRADSEPNFGQIDQLLRPVCVTCAKCKAVIFKQMTRYWISAPSQNHISFEILTDEEPVEGGTSGSIWGDDVRLNCPNHCHPNQWLVDSGSQYVDRHGFKYAIACGPELALAHYEGTAHFISALTISKPDPNIFAELDVPPAVNV